MQIPSLASPTQTLLSSTAQNLDGSRQAPGAVGGTSQPEDSSQLSGSQGSSDAVQSSAESLDQVAAPRQTEAIQTQVVTSADETLGTSLGLNIDTTA
jgi:hypothetical protein